MLLGMVGVFSAALIPMLLTHVVRGFPRRSEDRRRGLAFTWTVGAIAGLLAAVGTASITAAFAPPPGWCSPWPLRSSASVQATR